MKYRIKEKIKTYNGYQKKTYIIQCKILCWWSYWFDRYDDCHSFKSDGSTRVEFDNLEKAKEIKKFLETNTEKDLGIGYIRGGRFVYVDLGSWYYSYGTNDCRVYTNYSKDLDYVKQEMRARKRKEYENKLIGTKINYIY